MASPDPGTPEADSRASGLLPFHRPRLYRHGGPRPWLQETRYAFGAEPLQRLPPAGHSHRFHVVSSAPRKPSAPFWGPPGRFLRPGGHPLGNHPESGHPSALPGILSASPGDHAGHGRDHGGPHGRGAEQLSSPVRLRPRPAPHLHHRRRNGGDPVGSPHYAALFFGGVILLVMTLTVNLLSAWIEKSGEVAWIAPTDSGQNHDPSLLGCRNNPGYPGFSVLAFVFVRGYSVLSLDFLLEPPRDSMTRGGILTPSWEHRSSWRWTMAPPFPSGWPRSSPRRYARDDLFTASSRLAIGPRRRCPLWSSASSGSLFS